MSRPGGWTRARCALSSLWCSRAWSGAARTSMRPRTRCRRRCWRRCGCGPSIRRATRARGWRRSPPGGSPAPRRRARGGGWGRAPPGGRAAPRRSEAARHRREEATYAEPRPVVTEEGDDTLFLLFCCCPPDLPPASQVALTLRAVGGLTTREIADAFYVPEATMAQRISRAKRTLRGRRLDQPGDLAVVLRVLYLVYTAGHAGRVDLAREAIRLARQLTLATEEPEARGLLALMLLNHARLPARLDPDGRIVTLDRQDRGLWGTREIAEGVRVLQSALALERRGRYQVEAAIAALHDDAANAEETDWIQILGWYDELVAPTENPAHVDPAAVLSRAVSVGHVHGASAGLRETDPLRAVLGDRHRWHAVRGHLHELAGDLAVAGDAYAEAARRATNVAERDHLVRQAARARAA